MIAPRRLWIAIVLLALLSPLAIYVQQLAHAGAAWGEWGPEGLRGLVGYVPEGLQRTAAIWSAPLPDYAFRAADQPSPSRSGLAYAISALLGVAACAGAVYLAGRWLVGRRP